MSRLANGTVVTDIHNDTDNHLLASQGYTVRHIETFLDHDNQSFVTWDPPHLTEADLPF